jgi:hypothetical protein
MCTRYHWLTGWYTIKAEAMKAYLGLVNSDNDECVSDCKLRRARGMVYTSEFPYIILNLFKVAKGINE